MAYFAGATLSMGAVSGVVLGILLLRRSDFAQVFFGSKQMSDLILPIGLLIVGLTFHLAVYGYYRGCLLMGRANALEMTNFALAPIITVVVLFRTHSVVLIVSVMALSMVVSAVAFGTPLFRGMSQVKLSSLRPAVREMLRYGVARVPGEFAGSALFALGPVIATHYLPLSEVSRLLLGLSLLMAISVSVTPLGTVLLSKVSMMLAKRRDEEVRIRLEQLIAAVLDLSVFGCLQVIAFADVLIRTWVGPDYLAGLGVIQLTLLSIPFYLYFVAIRSAIDAASVGAHNAHNGYFALGVFLALTFLAVKAAPSQFLLHGIALALVAGNVVLAWLTTRVARDLFNLRIPWKECALPFLVALVLGLVSYAIRHQLLRNASLGTFMGIEALMTGTFLWASVIAGARWLPSFWNLLFEGGLKKVEQ